MLAPMGLPQPLMVEEPSDLDRQRVEMMGPGKVALAALACPCAQCRQPRWKWLAHAPCRPLDPVIGTPLLDLLAGSSRTEPPSASAFVPRSAKCCSRLISAASASASVATRGWIVGGFPTARGPCPPSRRRYSLSK